jgi:hypothetical protein
MDIKKVLPLLGLAALFWLWKSKKASAAPVVSVVGVEPIGEPVSKFGINDQIRLKDGSGPAWLITSMPTGAYYLSQLPTESGITTGWNTTYVEDNYSKIA